MKRVLLLAVLASLLAIPVSAYDMTELRSDMRVQIEKMMKDVGDVMMVHEATFETPESGMSALKSTTYMKGNRWRSDATMQGSGKTPAIDVTTLYDGTDMWSVTMGMKNKMPGGAMGQGGPSSLWQELPEDAKLLGEDKVSGRDTWKVQYEAAKGAPKSQGTTTMWLDKTTFFPIQMETDAFGKPVRTVMSDFRKVKGHDMAHLTEMFSDGKKTMSMKVLKVETGKGISDDLFDPEKLGGGEGTDLNDMMEKARAMQKQMEEQTKKGNK